MPGVLADKFVVLGVTGSIACYKALDLASKLTQARSVVDVILTREATHFVTPLAFRSLTHRPVVTDMFDPESELSLEHVALAQRADIVVVAPATAHTIARIAQGLADDALTSTILATQAPLVLAPAMDGNMYHNPATQENLARVQARGATVVGPASGRLASGLIGVGRLVETAEIMGNISAVLGRNGPLAGRKILVSAGGTQEPIDPVRMITNRSSGKMGYAIAEVARDLGARVILVTAAGLPDPVGVEIARVETAQQMRDAVVNQLAEADALIMAAAVADYKPATIASKKVKKGSGSWSIDLERTPDILSEVQGTLVKVGFAAETEQLLENARVKLKEKSLDLIVANDVTLPGSGFGVDNNKVTIIARDGSVDDLPLMSKHEVAHALLDRVAAILAARS